MPRPTQESQNSAIEQPRDIGRGDPHQGHRQDQPERQHKRVVARHPGDREDIVERHREIGEDDLEQRLRLRLLARPARRAGRRPVRQPGGAALISRYIFQATHSSSRPPARVTPITVSQQFDRDKGEQDAQHRRRGDARAR